MLMMNAEDATTIYVVISDIEMGETRTWLVPYGEYLLPFVNGTYLLLAYDMSQSANTPLAEESYPELFVFDPVTGACTSKGVLPLVSYEKKAIQSLWNESINSLCYHGQSDTLYYAYGGQVFALPGITAMSGSAAPIEKAMLVAYLPEGVSNHSPATMLDSNYFVVDGYWGGYCVQCRPPVPSGAGFEYLWSHGRRTSECLQEKVSRPSGAV